LARASADAPVAGACGTNVMVAVVAYNRMRQPVEADYRQVRKPRACLKVPMSFVGAVCRRPLKRFSILASFCQNRRKYHY
jgi:hypothetical protein